MNRLVRGLLVLAVALAVLFGGRALGLPEPVLVGIVVALALVTRLLLGGR